MSDSINTILEVTLFRDQPVQVRQWLLRYQHQPLPLGARYYDPSLGRWTQQGPVAGSLGDLGSADRYAYANDDPVNLVDPSGKSCSPTQILILGGVLFASLVVLAGALLAIPSSALASIAAFVAFASTPEGLGVILTAIGSILAAQFSALGLTDCLNS